MFWIVRVIVSGGLQGETRGSVEAQLFEGRLAR